MKKRVWLYLLLFTLILPQSVPVYAGSGRIPAFNTADRIVAAALAETGYKEGKNNDSKYGKWNGRNYIPWCGSFVSWCAHQAGVPADSIKPFSDNCMAEFAWFKSEKRWKPNTYKPNPGDVIFIDTQYKYEHTGLVVKYENGIVYTVEGNANDMVKERQYKRGDSRIIGYGIPTYAKAKTYSKTGLIGSQKVSLDNGSLTLESGSQAVLTARVAPKTTVTAQVWSSTDPKICSVNSKGEIIAKNKGEAVISVTITNGSTARCKIKVTESYGLISLK